MREILFRGKRESDGEWVKGYYVKSEKLNCSGYEHFIIEEGADGATHEVIPKTVGQYTGVNDKNGNRIFEGDIFKDSLGVISVVEWDGEDGRFLGFAVNKKAQFNPEKNRVITYIAKEPIVEVIGNIHDNPELLEED